MHVLAQSPLRGVAVSVIELEDLVVELAGRPVLRSLNARVDSRAVGLLGPNGAGKSTLLQTLLGFHRPAGGRACVFGLDVAKQAREIRSLVGYMPENESFVAGMSAVRFVRYMAELHGLPSDEAMERAHDALFWVGLGEARYRKVETFSTGMKQRVKLAQAIVHGPRLVFLDEPTNGLDPPGRAQMIRLVQELSRGEGVHLVISSHLLRDVEAVADHVLILKGGCLAASCDLAGERATDRRFVEMEVFDDPRAVAGELARQRLEHAPGRRGRLKVVLPPGVPTAELFAAAARAGTAVRRLHVRRDTLEDLFLQAMGDGAAEATHVG
jgi:ABC-2 type transport system ATP-binding protein